MYNERMTTEQLCNFYKITVFTALKYRKDGLPCWRDKDGHCFLYNYRDVEKWLNGSELVNSPYRKLVKGSELSKIAGVTHRAVKYWRDEMGLKGYQMRGGSYRYCLLEFNSWAKENEDRFKFKYDFIKSDGN